MNHSFFFTLLAPFLLASSLTPTKVHSFGFGLPESGLKKSPESVRKSIMNASSTARSYTGSPTSISSSRRDWMQKQSSSLLSILIVAPPSFAVEENVDEIQPEKISRMGGQLEKFQDGTRGFRMLAPSGWNKFEGEVGAYDVMWRDLVDTKENIKLSSTPVKSSTTSVALLGDVQVLGEALASKRNASLIKATSRTTDGVLYYNFEFAIKDGTHQMLQMCVGKSKLWSLDLNSSEKRWEQKKDMYSNIARSFVPKLG